MRPLPAGDIHGCYTALLREARPEGCRVGGASTRRFGTRLVLTVAEERSSPLAVLFPAVVLQQPFWRPSFGQLFLWRLLWP